MRGVISAGSQPTAHAGAEILRAGGNAADAIVAAAFASFTAEASISSLGGGGFALVQSDDTPPKLYDFFVAMPGLGADDFAQRLETLDFREAPISFADKPGVYNIGRGATAVPGNPAGLLHLHATYGRLPLADVLAPGIRLARAGFPMPQGQVSVIDSIKNVLLDTPESAAIFGRDSDTLKRGGDHFANPPFAETLEILARGGVDAFYKGEIARALVADHADYGGLITQADLAAYEVVERQPLTFAYGDHRIYTNPPPSVGGILIAYALRLLAALDLQQYDYHGADHVALLTEVMRQANIARYRDRPAKMTKTDAWQAYLARDLSDDVQAIQARLAGDAERIAPPREGDTRSTTHLSAVDENGLAIGITITPGATGGYVVGETGILTNNILGEPDLNPQGFHRATPGTRLTSMMSPSVVDTSAGQRFVVGSAGSSRIRSAILQVISNLLDWQLPLENAVNDFRVHFEKNVIDLEYGHAATVADALEQRGYAVKRWQEMHLYFGGAHAALQEADGTFGGAGDVRRGGHAIIVD